MAAPPRREHQIAIADLADLADLAEATGYDISAYGAADPLTATIGGQEAIENSEPLLVPLDSEEQIVV